MRIMTLLVALSLQSLLQAQLNTPFSNFSATDFNSGYFLPYSRVLNHELHSGTEFTPYTRPEIERMLFSLRKADLSGGALPTSSDLVTLQHHYFEWYNARPVSLFRIAYDDFASQAAENGWINLVNGEIALQHPQEEAIVSNETFFAHLQDDYFVAGTHRFIFPTDARYGWNDLDGAQTEVDFDDGLGFRNVEWDQPMEVTYESQEADRVIKVRITNGETVYRCAFRLKHSGSPSSIPLPETPPWPVPDPADPWMIQTNVGETVVSGNAYTLFSEDGIFDRPFIFVEGIDFGQTHGQLRNGFFGWYEFSSGNAENYDFLYNMPVLLQWLRSEGYDLIMLDFADGSDYIQHNAELLKHLIGLVKAHKSGQEELVIAGASMGGQVSRVALREMELEGLDHCTRLWISMDSPHEGASIPLSLQYTLYELQEVSSAAVDFVENYLEVPAARQMLLAHAGPYGDERTDYQGYLNNLGYPKHCRSVAIANGSGIGLPLSLIPGEPLLDYECEALGVVLSKFYLLSHPGDPFHELSTPMSNLLSQTIFVEDVDCSGISCILSAIFGQHNEQSFASPNGEPYDTCPGGKRPSIAQFADALNDELGSAGNLGLICDTQVSDYYPDHSFIPTVSALGLTSGLMTSAEVEIANSESFPFDNYYAPESNTYHSELTNEMLAFIWNEIVAGEPILGDQLNDDLAVSTFNFGLPPHYVLDAITISNEGELQINGDEPIHFGEDPNLFPEPGSSMYVRTSECHPGEIIVDQDGKLILGAENSQCSGVLDIRRGSTLRVKEGGLLRLVEQSSVIVREGATLIAEGGVIDVSDGSSLLIEEGAILEIHQSAPIYISDPDSRIRIAGNVILNPYTDAIFTHLPDHSNGAVVFEGTESIQGNFTNRLHIVGSNTSDLLVEIASYSELSTAPGFEEVRIEDGIVRLQHSAMLSTTASFNLRHAEVIGLDQPDGIVIYNASLIEQCEVNNCPFTAILNNESVRFLGDHLASSPIRIYGGGYRIESSVLTASPVESWLRTLNARILSSSFSGCEDVAVHDQSIPLLRVVDSEFFANDKGILNSGGELLLRCNAFTECGTAVVASSFTFLNMSSDVGAGYNYFDDNGTHIRLHAAVGMLLFNGFNAFLSFNDYTFYGNMAGNCDDSCSLLLNASGNTWQYGSPLEVTYLIHIPDMLCDSDSPLNPFDGCYLKLVDKYPVQLTACGTADLPPQNADLSGKSITPDQKSDRSSCTTKALLEQATHCGEFATWIENNREQKAPGHSDVSTLPSIIETRNGSTEIACHSNSAFFAESLRLVAAYHSSKQTKMAIAIAEHLRDCLEPGIQQQFAAWYAEALNQTRGTASISVDIEDLNLLPLWNAPEHYRQSSNTKNVCLNIDTFAAGVIPFECTSKAGQQTKKETGFSVTPNPGNRLFRLTLRGEEKDLNQWTVQVRSLEGQVIMNTSSSGPLPLIDLKGHSAGVYFISVTHYGEHLGTHRLILMH